MSDEIITTPVTEEIPTTPVVEETAAPAESTPETTPETTPVAEEEVVAAEGEEVATPAAL